MIRQEIEKLRKASFIEPILYPPWLANPVLTLKENGQLHMCINYTSLNKACLKDSFPLPRIDQIIDSTSGCEYLCLLDAYSEYHQIRMRERDIPHTSFITPFGIFCYKTMPLGMKNVGCTY